MNIKTLAEGKFLGLYKQGHWEFAERPNSTGSIGILPITHDGQIVLVEQFRIPCQANVIEIPAGLAGDEAAFADESLSDCAARELLEETGYRAGKITPLLSAPTSAGMTSEMTHFFAATELTKEQKGGGVGGENITVHHVSLSKLNEYLDQKQKEGVLIDFKIHASLHLAQQCGLTL